MSLQNVASPKFAGLYIPVFSYAYLYIERASVCWLSPKWSLYFSIITLLGAVILHSIFRSIYGPGGPKENPKSDRVSKYYMQGLLLSYNPIPYEEVHEDLPNNVLDRITVKYRRITQDAGWRAFITVPTVGALIILTWLSVVFLYLYLTNSGVSGQTAYTGGILLITQTAFLLRGRVNRFFPPSNSTHENIDEPEFRVFFEKLRVFYSEAKGESNGGNDGREGIEDTESEINQRGEEGKSEQE